MSMAITFVIDISHHQDKRLDLAQTRRDGCELCLMKAGEGSTFVDEDFASNLAEARAAGQLVGAYWYQRASASAAAHVAKIRQVVPVDVPVIMDVEANSGGVALTREIIRQLNAVGYRTPLLYIPRWYWQQIGSPSLVGLPPLWSSRYPDMLVGTLADEWADVPASYWNGYGGLDVALLQFTSSARIAGYQPLDASAFRGTRAELAALLNQEDDMLEADERAILLRLGALFPDIDHAGLKARNLMDPGSLTNAMVSPYIDTYTKILPSLAGILAGLEKSTTDPDITAANMKQWIDDAVAQHIQITGEVHIGPAELNEAITAASRRTSGGGLQ